MPPTVTVAPAGAILLAIAVAERAGAERAVFYLFLLATVVGATGALAGFGRLVDAANGGGTPALGRFQAALAVAFVGLCVLGASARSPLALELDAPGLAPVALVLAGCVLALQALTALVAVRR